MDISKFKFCTSGMAVALLGCGAPSSEGENLTAPASLTQDAQEVSDYGLSVEDVSDELPGDEPVGAPVELGLGYPNGEVVLAQFKLSHGSTVTFFADAMTGDYGVEEVGDAGTSPSFRPDLDVTPLERFLLLTDESVPVPDLLVELEKDEDIRLLAEVRERTFALEPMEIDIAPGSTFAVEGQANYIVNDDWSCSNDTSAAFADDFCVSSGGGSKVEYCGSGAWYQLLQGPQSRDESYSVTGYCKPGGGGGASGRTWHEARRKRICSSGFGWAWCRSGSVIGVGHNQWKWQHRSGNRYNRRVWHERTGYPNGSGHVRGYTALFN